MTEKERQIRGGIVLEARVFGSQGQYTALWCIHPATHEERAITVWTTEHTPQTGDQLWWHRGHSPGWKPQGTTTARAAFLPRIGASYDPSKQFP